MNPYRPSFEDLQDKFLKLEQQNRRIQQIGAAMLRGFEATLGTEELVTKPTGETQTRSTASLVLFDKNQGCDLESPVGYFQGQRCPTGPRGPARWTRTERTFTDN